MLRHLKYRKLSRRESEVHWRVPLCLTCVRTPYIEPDMYNSLHIRDRCLRLPVWSSSILPWHNDRLPSGPGVHLIHYRRLPFGSYHCANGHEESRRRRSAFISKHGPRRSYPNVAAEPSMYCPKVLMGPLTPAPYLIMLKPPILFSAGPPNKQSVAMLTKDEAHNQPHSFTLGQPSCLMSFYLANPQPPSIAPIFPLNG